jgi:S-adenosylmethionine-dependent methyltransferase
VANRAAAVLARAAAGQFDVALTSLDGAPAGRDTVRRRYDVESATELLAKAGLTVDEVHGVRVVADLVPGGFARQPGASQRSEERTGPRPEDDAEREHEGLVAFELAVAARSPYRDIATQLHLLARRA